MKNIKKIILFLLCSVIALSSFACGGSKDDGCAHNTTIHRQGVAATCETTGTLEHWECVSCGKLFADKECTQEITDTVEPKKAHDMNHHARVEATETTSGNIEYWDCKTCHKYFLDAQGKSEINQEDTALLSLYDGLIDFVVNVDENRDPIILQLADPQIIDSSTMRSPTRLDEAKKARWDENSRQALCYDYITELVNEVHPDLVLVTGDVIYGEFDDNGHLHTEFINFMESLNVKWSPVMGNHDLETKKGAKWVCTQYENAPNCLFKRGDIKGGGNGNFIIGIRQFGELKRIFVNLDTNGCTGASDSSKKDGYTVSTTNNSYGVARGVYGLQKNQVSWFNNRVNGIKAFKPEVKISFHFHIPMTYFYTAYNNAYKDLVGDPVAGIREETSSGAYYLDPDKALWPERVIGHTEGDFGVLLFLYNHVPRSAVDWWDCEEVNGQGKGDEIYNQIKALGTDSIFVGHVHQNSTSIVYDGIRFQYGQKSSLYDNCAVIDSEGVAKADVYLGGTDTRTPLIGGTVIPLDETTGELKDPYIQYCSGAGKEIDWNSYKNTIAPI